LLWVGHGRPPVGVTRPCIIGERPGRPGASSLALAWAPSHARPFTAHRFGRRHPGHQEGIKTEGLLGPRLRKASATIAAESGATEAELNAMFGWTGHQMAQLYTKRADRQRLAARAMAKWARPSSDYVVGKAELTHLMLEKERG